MSFRGPGFVWVEDRREGGRKEEGEREGGEKGCSIWALCIEMGYLQGSGHLDSYVHREHSSKCYVPSVQHEGDMVLA